jgi:hypothetical protein
MNVEIGASKNKMQRSDDSTSRGILGEVGYSPYPGAFDDNLTPNSGDVGFTLLFSRVGLCKCEVHRAARAKKLSAE